MSKAFINFLSNNGSGLNFKSYAHATNLYVNNKFAKAPKFGFLYFVAFNINPAAVKDPQWISSGGAYDVGMLVKKIDLPKFKITTETLNQYNRKTNIQTKIAYENVSIDFHDDNSEVTNGLWKNYYKYYYVDSNYGDINAEQTVFGDTKYDAADNAYGYNNAPDQPFFESIDIYVLHQQRFTQVRLMNPVISSWDHDSLDQSNGTKILQNKMSVAYDNVLYYQGKIENDDGAYRFKARYYDNEPGAIQVGSGPNMATQQAPEAVFGPKWEPTPVPIPNYPTPTPVFSNSQLNKAVAQAGPSYTSPQPLGYGTFSVGYRRPSTFGISGLNIWWGHGGLHGTGVVRAGPLRLVLKK